MTLALAWNGKEKEVTFFDFFASFAIYTHHILMQKPVLITHTLITETSLKCYISNVVWSLVPTVKSYTKWKNIPRDSKKVPLNSMNPERNPDWFQDFRNPDWLHSIYKWKEIWLFFFSFKSTTPEFNLAINCALFLAQAKRHSSSTPLLPNDIWANSKLFFFFLWSFIMVTDVEEGQNQYPAFQVTREVIGLAARKHLLTWELKKI